MSDISEIDVKKPLKYEVIKIEPALIEMDDQKLKKIQQTIAVDDNNSVDLSFINLQGETSQTTKIQLFFP